MPINYANTKIYKIFSYSGDKIYIGATTKQYLSQAMSKHRDNYTQYKKGKTHHISLFDLFDEYEISNCLIELIDSRPCANKNEAVKFQGEYVKSLNCINKNIPGRTDKEYYQDNKVKILDYKKEYYETNKENMNEISKQYFKDNKERLNEKNACECGGHYTFKNKSTHLKSIRHLKYLDNPISGYSLLYA
jgi:hypothetical protein